jgi:hypothetical protein
LSRIVINDIGLLLFRGEIINQEEMDLNVSLLLQNPAYQALLFLLFTPILIFLIRPKSAETAWTVAACAFGLFLIVNAGLLWLDDSPWRYFFYSIGVAVGYLVFIPIIIPGVLRVLKLKGSEESSMAFLILIYQPFALLFVMLVKWIVTNWL